MIARFLAAALLALAVAFPAFAAENFVKDGFAIGGADPVAYFTEGGPLAGSGAFTAEYRGVTWKFASAENRDLFLADPEKYAEPAVAPQLDDLNVLLVHQCTPFGRTPG